MAKTILAATTSAANSDEFVVSQKPTPDPDGRATCTPPVVVTAEGLANSEMAHLQMLSGSAWQDVGDPATNPLFQEASILFSQLTSGAAFEALDILSGAVQVGGYVDVTTVFDSATSDVLDVGDGSDPDRYTSSQIDLQVEGVTALDVTRFKYTSDDTVDVTWTGTGTAPSQGAFDLVFVYIVDGQFGVSKVSISAGGEVGSSRMVITEPGVYRVVKEATASNGAIYLHTPTDP